MRAAGPLLVQTCGLLSSCKSVRAVEDSSVFSSCQVGDAALPTVINVLVRDCSACKRLAHYLRASAAGWCFSGTPDAVQ